MRRERNSCGGTRRASGATLVRDSSGHTAGGATAEGGTIGATGEDADDLPGAEAAVTATDTVMDTTGTTAGTFRNGGRN